MASEGLHEEPRTLSPESQELHRALRSAIEELDAVDWYTQRAAATADEPLRRILLHNRDEEIEHFSMLVEWLRRRLPPLDDRLRAYLFSTGDITEIEATEEAGGA